jgi:hypothetical protein
LDGEGWGYIGITSATGNAYERHELLAWKFCTFSYTFVSSIEEKNVSDNKDKEFLILTEQNPKILIRSYNYYKIEVFNSNGMLVYKSEQNLNNGNEYCELNFSLLPTGIYFIKVSAKEQISIFKVLRIK